MIFGWIPKTAQALWERGHAFVDERGSYKIFKRMFSNPQYPEGRTLTVLRNAIGQPNSDAGRERTRELLARVPARQVIRTDPNAEEMWTDRPLT